jgi:hypothetical protein
MKHNFVAYRLNESSDSIYRERQYRRKLYVCAISAILKDHTQEKQLTDVPYNTHTCLIKLLYICCLKCGSDYLSLIDSRYCFAINPCWRTYD